MKGNEALAELVEVGDVVEITHEGLDWPVGETRGKRSNVR